MTERNGLCPYSAFGLRRGLRIVSYNVHIARLEDRLQ